WCLIRRAPPTKPSPNESTLTLNARGARRAALGSGSPGKPCAFQRFGLGSVTPKALVRLTDRINR
ncbi:MAG: hypothetical protein OSB31_10175, partial [Paracoccaceae bacterium]|nr:hypothetical protein [Paracoccaceae bacterium]